MARVHCGGTVEAVVWDVKDGIVLITDKQGLIGLYANRPNDRKIGFRLDDMFHV